MSFIKEVFNGFISWDAKFWTTIFPLLTRPGKVSRDFIEGKRQRYSNPFQFYLTISILFFLILGLVGRYEDFQELSSGKKQKASFSLINTPNKKELDSVANNVQNELQDALKNIDSTDRAKALKFIPQNIQDSIAANKGRPMIDISESDSKVGKMMKFRRDHPSATFDEALDSLEIKKTFFNRFLYSKAEIFNAFQDDPEKTNEEFTQEIVSYASISLFIFLPIFTMFIRFIYIRRKYTYVEHLIFVFHTQTVFFILLTIFYLMSLFVSNTDITLIFSGLFLIYLFIAMKRFYKQGYFKTFFKFILLNLIYFFLGGIGFVIVAAVAFSLY